MHEFLMFPYGELRAMRDLISESRKQSENAANHAATIFALVRRTSAERQGLKIGHDILEHMFGAPVYASRLTSYIDAQEGPEDVQISWGNVGKLYTLLYRLDMANSFHWFPPQFPREGRPSLFMEKQGKILASRLSVLRSHLAEEGNVELLAKIVAWEKTFYSSILEAHTSVSKAKKIFSEVSGPQQKLRDAVRRELGNS